MMTRETKAGLVVSCSFLCLVGIVLFSKLTEKDQVVAKEDAEDEKGWKPDSGKDAGGKNTDKKSESPTGTGHAKAFGAPENLPVSFQDGAKPLEGTQTPAPPPSKASGKNEPTKPQSAPSSPAVASKPAKQPGSAFMVPGPSLDDFSFPNADKQKTTASTLGNGASVPLVTTGPTESAPSKTGVLGADAGWGKDNPKVPAKFSPRSSDPAPLATGVTRNQSEPAGQTKKKNSLEETFNKGSFTKDAATTPVAKGTPSITSVGPSAPDKAQATATPTWPATAGTSSTLGGAGNPSQDQINQAPSRTADATIGFNVPEQKPVRLTSPEIPPANQFARATGGPSNSPSLRDTRPQSIPPLGAPVAASTVPIPAPAPSSGLQPLTNGVPDVDSYDEETFTCRPNETFRSISQTFFRTDKYERALMLFNRNHPLANDPLRRDPPLLQAGQPVYIPPTRILEKYYASAIGDAPAAQNIDIIAPSPVRAPAPAATDRTYRVGAAGEMFRDIARRTLNDADRWPEIYRLNPSYDPQELVPAGASLRLPADARVDSR